MRAASNEARAQGDVIAFAKAALVYDNARFLSNEPSRDFIALLKEAKSLVGTGDLQTRCHILSRLARAYLVLGDVEAQTDTIGGLPTRRDDSMIRYRASTCS